jgi:hypothetical protein
MMSDDCYVNEESVYVHDVGVGDLIRDPFGEITLILTKRCLSDGRTRVSGLRLCDNMVWEFGSAIQIRLVSRLEPYAE